MRVPMRSSERLGLILLVSAAAILWIGQATDLDLRLADAAYDPGLRDFPLRHAWLTERFNHVLVKYALTVLGAACILSAAWDRCAPWPLSALRRVQLRVLALSAVLVPLAISCMKQVASSHCPWDLARYGGVMPYVRLLENMPSGIMPGNCMPAGHASTALWLAALAVFWLPARPRTAAAVFGVLLGLGFAVGWLQQLRGAHFLTHTLWSMWVSCAVIMAAARLADPHAMLRQARQVR